MSPTSRKLQPDSGWKTARSVLLCGASVRSLAESAIAARIRPLCVDFFEDQDLTDLLASGRGRFVGRINSFHELPAVIRSVRSNVPLLWAGGLENHTDLLREISRHRPVIGAELNTVDTLRDPERLNRWLEDAEISMPRLSSPASADVDCLWLRKATSHSGGLGIGLFPSTGENSVASTGDRGYLQEYIDGVPMSATFCSDSRGIELLGFTLQAVGWPSLGASGFLFCGNIGPVDPGEIVTRQVLEAARILVEKSRLKGIFGVDFILRREQAWFIEINPRITASHLLFELRYPGLVTHRHLEALGWKSAYPPRSLESRTTRPLVELSTVASRLILWTRNELHVPKSIETQPGDPLKVVDRPPFGSIVSESSPLCSIWLTGDDIEELIRTLSFFDEDVRTPKKNRCPGLKSLGYSFGSIGGQLQLLWQKFRHFTE